MPEMLSFFVQGNPKGQPRPRAFAINGKARVYDAGTAEGWKSCVARALGEQKRIHEFGGRPVSLHLHFIMPRPRHHYRTGRHAGQLKGGAPYYHTNKPDNDNLTKAIMDCLTELRIWRDDRQVAEIKTTKRYGEQPGCHIWITELIDPLNYRNNQTPDAATPGH